MIVPAVLLWPICCVSLAAAVYAHATLTTQSESAANARITRAMLLLTALAFAAVTALWFAPNLPGQLLIAMTSFGVVHIPAACILFLKRLRARQDV